MKIVNIGYTHSKITQAIFSAASEQGILKFDGFIYGRGYCGFSGNSIYFQEDKISSELMILSYAFIFNRYLESLTGGGGVRLFIPHFNNIFFRLLSTHKRVEEVFYVEEGDLSFEAHRLQHSVAPPSIGGGGVFEILKSIGFDFNQWHLANSNWASGWFYDVFGKYRGVLVSGSGAFTGFPGERLTVEFRKVEFFEDKVGIIVLTDELDFCRSIYGRFKGGISIEKLLRSISVYFLSEINRFVDRFGAQLDRIYVKAHPGGGREFYDKLKKSLAARVDFWEDSNLPYLTRNHELGLLNFSHALVLGESSFLIYKKNSGSFDMNLTVVSSEDVVRFISGFLVDGRLPIEATDQAGGVR